MKVLREKTKGLCPVCRADVEARVVEENGAVFLEKQCVDHGQTKAMVETDPYYYQRVVYTGPVPDSEFKTLIIPVEYRCNMTCKYCYLPYDNQENLTLNEIKSIINRFDGEIISLSGGEPTLRGDLLDIIAYIAKKKKKACLVTNGLKLADRDYTNRLLHAGLNTIVFGFNGFSGNSDSDIYGMEDATEKKYAALENLRAAKFRNVILSATVARSVNDHELFKIFKYCARNRDVISQLRLRSVARVGRHGESPGYYMSELVELFANQAGLTKRDIIDKFIHRGFKQTNHHFMARFYYIEQGDEIKLLPDINEELLVKNGTLGAISAAYRAGAASPLRMIRRLVHKKKPQLIPNLMVRFISWPDVETFDYSQAFSGTSHLVNQRDIVDFCYALVFSDKI